MKDKFKILAKFIKDASSETADIETYLFVKEMIPKYQLNIDITSKAVKNKIYFLLHTYIIIYINNILHDHHQHLRIHAVTYNTQYYIPR